MRMGRLVVVTGFAVLAGALSGGTSAAAVADIRASALGPGSAAVSWQVAGATRAWVDLGRSTPFGVWYPAARQSDGHFVATLTGLAPSTTYAFRVRTVSPAGSADALGSAVEGACSDVIAVNPSYDPASAIISLKGIGPRSFTVFGESRTVQTRRSLLVDRFEPLAVHVYVAAPR
jgi:hypothetical protein